jgi:hypothetical protein
MKVSFDNTTPRMMQLYHPQQLSVSLADASGCNALQMAEASLLLGCSVCAICMPWVLLLCSTAQHIISMHFMPQPP